MTRPTPREIVVQHKDLLNLFFGALANDDARRTVEFHKGPKDIDEVVDHVMYYRWVLLKPDFWEHENLSDL